MIHFYAGAAGTNANHRLSSRNLNNIFFTIRLTEFSTEQPGVLNTLHSRQALLGI